MENWRHLDRESERRYREDNYSGIDIVWKDMTRMGKSLERDPQLESLLANRKAALVIQMETGRRLGRDLAFEHGLDIGRSAADSARRLYDEQIALEPRKGAVPTGSQYPGTHHKEPKNPCRIQTVSSA